MPILNLATLDPKPRITDDDFQRSLNQIKRDVQLGVPLKQIANDVGISTNTISTMLAQHGTSVKELRASRPQWRMKKGRNDDN